MSFSWLHRLKEYSQRSKEGAQQITNRLVSLQHLETGLPGLLCSLHYWSYQDVRLCAPEVTV